MVNLPVGVMDEPALVSLVERSKHSFDISGILVRHLKNRFESCNSPLLYASQEITLSGSFDWVVDKLHPGKPQTGAWEYQFDDSREWTTSIQE